MCIIKFVVIAGERFSVGVSAATFVKRSNVSGYCCMGSFVFYSVFNW